MSAKCSVAFRRWKLDVGCSTFAIFICMLLTGCTRLAPGDLKANLSSSRHVYIFRGYLDWYSKGMDQLTAKLLNNGINATAFREEQWGDVGDQLLQYPRPDLVLIGFSYGADDAILIARRLNEHHSPVKLLITIDPVTPAAVPPNIANCVNFYEPNGLWDIFPWLRGVPVKADSGARATNVNIRVRSDLNEPGTSHSTIAANEKVHNAIIEWVKNVR